MKAKKRLGQHFLTSKKALRTIIEAAQIEKNETVLEIGPGTGVLTRELLDASARVIAVETDVEMIAVLEEQFEEEIAKKQLTLLNLLELNMLLHLILKRNFIRMQLI